MIKANFPQEFLDRLGSISAKRARTVIDHILKHGQISTDDLKNTYGYIHPPRAIQDVRDNGIPILKFSVRDADGKTIAAYRFGNPAELRTISHTGRSAPSKALKTNLISIFGARCNLYQKEFAVSQLQIDHRIPFEIGGNPAESPDDPARNFMLLCSSANRAKSWSCEHCPNWVVKNIETCKKCYWAYPESYSHVAMRDIRRVELIWADGEISEYEKLAALAKSDGVVIPEYVKRVLVSHFRLTKDTE